MSGWPLMLLASIIGVGLLGNVNEELLKKIKILHLMSKVQITRDYIPTLFLMVRSPLEY